MEILPTKIAKAGPRTLKVQWSDDRQDLFDVVMLRRSCRCANCVNEMTGEQILRPEQVSEAVRPVKVTSLGRYALNFEWSDGHSSIFSWDLLRKLPK
jgi:DUF971 family protein